MRDKSGSVAAIAWRQHGLVTAAQLRAVGVTRSSMSRWSQQQYLAAVLACGDGAVLSGHASTWVFGLVHRPPKPEVSTTRHREVPGVLVHCVRHLAPGDTTRWRGIPTTSLPRTLADLAPRLPLDDLALLCHRAEAIHGTKLASPGHWKLRAIFDGDAPILLSRLEREFIKLLRAEGVPLPITNRRADGRYVDCRWPGHRLTVELDSFSHHNTRHSWEEDRQRERDARARGDEFRRFTWRDVVEQPGPMLSQLQTLLVTNTEPDAKM